jgi:hypothetical protein
VSDWPEVSRPRLIRNAFVFVVVGLALAVLGVWAMRRDEAREAAARHGRTPTE